nr:hypothetical protein [uncultured Carboxylicivirga sp.]
MKLTINNYKEATKHIDFSKLPEAAREAHKEFDSFADFYNEDKDIKEMLDNHFKIVEPHLKDEPKKSPAKEKAPAKSKAKKAAPKTSTRNKTAKRKSTPKKAVRKTNEVPLIPLEVRIIKRYLNLHDKTVSEKQVSLLYKVIQKAATERTIRKTSKYALVIKRIGDDLASTYKEMNNTAKFEVPNQLKATLDKIVDSYGVTPAVSLIKRFINLYGNITMEKAQRLLTSIKNAKKSDKVSSKDSAYDRVNQVQKHLEDYLESDKLLVTDIQLNGLKGLAGLGK